jgi:hypothetical protein
MENVDAILFCDSVSTMLMEQRISSEMVIGVPHHAPAGKGRLPCKSHPVSDENAGIIGRYIAESLGCHSVIACNYFLDPNKCLHTDYSLRIKEWNPKYLIEIHGHGKGRRHGVEISSGCAERNKYSTALAECLKAKCHMSSALRDIRICGDFSAVYFKATESATITCDDWIPLHIELPDFLRKVEDLSQKEPPNEGYEFCNYLIDCLKGLCK